MLVRSEGRSNPFSEISSIAAFWFFWGTVLGICLLATAQRVVVAVKAEADLAPHLRRQNVDSATSGHGGSSPANPPMPALPSNE